MAGLEAAAGPGNPLGARADMAAMVGQIVDNVKYPGADLLTAVPQPLPLPARARGRISKRRLDGAAAQFNIGCRPAQV